MITTLLTDIKKKECVFCLQNINNYFGWTSESLMLWEYAKGSAAFQHVKFFPVSGITRNFLKSPKSNPPPDEARDISSVGGIVKDKNALAPLTSSSGLRRGQKSIFFGSDSDEDSPQGTGSSTAGSWHQETPTKPVTSIDQIGYDFIDVDPVLFDDTSPRHSEPPGPPKSLACFTDRSSRHFKFFDETDTEMDTSLSPRRE